MEDIEFKKLKNTLLNLSYEECMVFLHNKSDIEVTKDEGEEINLILKRKYEEFEDEHEREMEKEFDFFKSKTVKQFVKSRYDEEIKKFVLSLLFASFGFYISFGIFKSIWLHDIPKLFNEHPHKDSLLILYILISIWFSCKISDMCFYVVKKQYQNMMKYKKEFHNFKNKAVFNR